MPVCPYVVAKRGLSWGNKTLEFNVDLRQNKSLILSDKYYIFRKRSILNLYIYIYQIKIVYKSVVFFMTVRSLK